MDESTTERNKKKFYHFSFRFSFSCFSHGDNFKRQWGGCLTALNPFLWCFIFSLLPHSFHPSKIVLEGCCVERWISHFMVYFTEPLRNFLYFPTALLIRSIVHLFSRCIISLFVSILSRFKRFPSFAKICVYDLLKVLSKFLNVPEGWHWKLSVQFGEVLIGITGCDIKTNLGIVKMTSIKCQRKLLNGIKKGNSWDDVLTISISNVESW